MAEQRLERSPRQAEVAFGGLVRVSCSTQHDGLAAPAWLCQLEAEDVGEVLLHQDLRSEVLAIAVIGFHVEIAGEAVNASMPAARVRIERPAKRHTVDTVERGLA